MAVKFLRVQGFRLKVSVGKLSFSLCQQLDSTSSVEHLNIILALTVLYDFRKRVGNKLHGEDEDQYENDEKRLKGRVAKSQLGFSQGFKPVEILYCKENSLIYSFVYLKHILICLFSQPCFPTLQVLKFNSD